MIHKITAFSTSVLIAMAILSGTGCVGISQGPSLGFMGIPIPVTPYLQDKQEDKFWIHERYERVPILGPVDSRWPRPHVRSAQRR